MKWIHLKSKHGIGSATIMVPQGITVWQFKQMVGLQEESMLNVPAMAFPLPDQVVLSRFVENFDTVYVE